MKHKLTACMARPAALPLLCYALALLCWLALGVRDMISDAGLPTWQQNAADLELVELQELGGGSYTAYSMDPQMIWHNPDGRRVRTLSYSLTFVSEEPREICLYYATAQDQAFSADRRVFPTRDANGRYVYILPRAGIMALRLDPCSPEIGHTVTLTFEQDALVFNAADTLPHGLGYFLPGWAQLFSLVLYPALAAAMLDWLAAAIKWLQKAV